MIAYIRDILYKQHERFIMFKSSNVGTSDRLIRVILGVALLLAPYLFVSSFLANPIMRWVMLIAGAVLIFTAIMRFCPLYRLFGLNSCKAKDV